MANGTTDEKLARADRIKEQSARAQQQAEQHQKATRNAIASIREILPDRDLPPYRAEMDSSSELTAPGITAKMPLPERARLAIGYALAVVLVATGIGGVIVAVAKLLN